MQRSLNTPAAGAIAALLLAGACTKTTPADAFGNFEAEEVAIAAETNGQLLRFEPVEGQAVEAKRAVGLVDTVQLALERDQLVAQRAGLADRRKEAEEQVKALEVQHEIALRSRQRADRLFGQQAATSQQRDQAERDERVLGLQVSSSRAALDRIATDKASLDARIAAVQDKIRRATLTSPVSGTVLATYVRTGEVIQPGQPLYRVANLDTLTLRAYVTGDQLQSFTLGEQVQVHVDGPDKTLKEYHGTVSWVSSKAEFTPTPVQTRDERSNLVYAVKVRVANPGGALKIGMPGDVTLAPPPPGAPRATPAKGTAAP
jgi:HlyD family secretion protein